MLTIKQRDNLAPESMVILPKEADDTITMMFKDSIRLEQMEREVDRMRIRVKEKIRQIREIRAKYSKP